MESHKYNNGYGRALWILTGLFLGLFFQGANLLAGPDIVTPTLENAPGMAETSYVISDITAANRLNMPGDLYTIILQSDTPPGKATLVQIARKLWQNRLPRTSQFLEVQFHLPQIETRDLPYAAVTITADGIRSVNIQDWILDRTQTSIKFGLTSKTRQVIFQKLVAFDSQNTDNPDDSMDPRSELREKFHISKRIQDAIVFEGITQGWTAQR